MRQSTGESLNARGLTNGGDVTVGGAVAPGSATRPMAHSLGGGVTADLQREQGLEQNELVAQRDTALSDVNAGGKQGIVDALGAGVSTGFGVYGAGQQLGAGGGASPTPGAAPSSVGTIRGAYGIDPLNPVMPPRAGTVLGMGQQNSQFNVG
jgi:hypothetical protein